MRSPRDLLTDLVFWALIATIGTGIAVASVAPIA